MDIADAFRDYFYNLDSFINTMLLTVFLLQEIIAVLLLVLGGIGIILFLRTSHRFKNTPSELADNSLSVEKGEPKTVEPEVALSKPAANSLSIKKNEPKTVESSVSVKTEVALSTAPHSDILTEQTTRLPKEKPPVNMVEGTSDNPPNYVIRRNAFGYNDEGHEYEGPGKVDSTFSTLEAAEAYRRSLHREMLLQYGFAAENLLFNLGFDRRKLSEYFQANFGIELLYEAHPNQFNIRQDILFPRTLTEAQAEDIMRITGLQLTSLVELKDQCKFYRLISNDKFYQLTNNTDGAVSFGTELHSDFIFNSKLDAERFAHERIDEDLYLLHINGTLDSLSKSPEILKAYVDSQEGMNFNPELLRIELNGKRDPAIFGLFDLLEEPPYLIIEHSYEEMKQRTSSMHDEFEKGE